MIAEYKRILFRGSRMEITFEGRPEVVVVEFGDASEDFEPSVILWPEDTNGAPEPKCLWTGKGESESDET